MKKSKYLRYAYWEALLIVRVNQFFMYPKYMYGWWIARLNLIRAGEI